MQPTENFDLLVNFKEVVDDDVEPELIGMEELEDFLQKKGSFFYIKESEFFDVVLVELGMDPVNTALELTRTPTKAIKKAVPIESVVYTGVENIVNCVREVAALKMFQGESFTVRCNLRDRKYINSQKELTNRVSEELIIELGVNLREENPDWIVQVEIVGRNTGITIYRPQEIPIE
jgi:tRNA acetyltransferase TAN1